MLTLIGTSHLDLDGEGRLRKLLQYLNPNMIGIEETEADFKETSDLVRKLSNRDTFERALNNAQKQFSKANPETLRLWLSSLDYENKVIGEYSASNNIQILYCDNPQELAKVDFDGEAKKPQSLPNVKMEKFLTLSPQNAIKDIDREYSLTEYPVKDNSSLAKFYQARDKFTEQTLRTQTGNVVYVCGLDHIFGDYHPNLFDMLADINPQRMKLIEADKL